jgi:1,5-anhydro-D-fructose reductase (1,5-anhydro-D-mannitol-forming)
MIRIGMVSYWHVHAWDYTKQVQAHPDTEVAAVWDEIPERGKAAAAKQGVPFYENLDELLARDDIQAVVIDAPTNIHREVMVAAAKAGKHIFTEKVVAATLADVNAILAAVDAAGVKLTVSLPRLNAGYTKAIQALIADGAVGEVTLVRARLSHNGALPNDHSKDGWLPPHFYSLEQCGGGALIDLGCHPMYLTQLFLGALPTSISATFGYVTGRAVEDNAVATLTGPNGAVGIVEAGFVNPCSPFTIEVHGTGGTLLYGTPEATLLLRKASDSAWGEVEVPADVPSAFEQWVGHIQQGTTATENIQAALDLTKLMEAANLSAASGAKVTIADLKA